MIMEAANNALIEVLLDPGHGGKDRRNVGPTGYVEADGVLKICKFLKEELDRCKKFNTELTRTVDKTLSFEQRTPKKKIGLFLSMHTNGFDGTVTGSEVIYSLRRPEDKKLAEKLATIYSKELLIPDRGADTKTHPTLPNTDYFAAIRNSVAAGATHSFIAEPIFHDHPKSEKLLLQDANLRKIAVMTAKWICSIFNVVYISAADIEKFPEAKQWAISKGLVDTKYDTNTSNPIERDNVFLLLFKYLQLVKPGVTLANGKPFTYGYGVYRADAAYNETDVINNLVRLGITDGTRPNSFITREELFTLLFNVFGYNFNLVSPKTAEELNCSDWAIPYVNWIKVSKISDGSNPKKVATVGQVYQMLYNADSKF